MLDLHLIHRTALTRARDFRGCEKALLEILMEVEKHQVHFHLGFASLFRYCVDALELTESQSYTLITVARKSKNVPALKASIDAGKITISSASRIAAVITPANQTDWIGKAAAHSLLTVVIDEEDEKLIRRMQDLLSQKSKKPASLQEALKYALKLSLEKIDPLEKAKRSRAPRATTETKTIPSQVRHQVALRDEARCAFVDVRGKRCESRRWLDVHHVIHRGDGGKHLVSNLTTLCSAHHRYSHAGHKQNSAQAEWFFPKVEPSGRGFAQQGSLTLTRRAP